MDSDYDAVQEDEERDIGVKLASKSHPRQVTNRTQTKPRHNASGTKQPLPEASTVQAKAPTTS